MKLMDCELRPGTVISVLDGGKIIASVPGLFSKEDKDKLPPISSFFEGSRVNVGDDVWIMNSVTDKMQLHWIKKNNSESRYECSTNKEIPKNAQIICNEGYGGGVWAYIIFEDGKGIIMKNNNSYININPSGDIILSNGTTDRTISITPESISLGQLGKSEHPAAYGDILQEFATSLVIILKGIICVTASNAILSPIANVISEKIVELDTLSTQIKSTNVTLQ